MPRQMRFCRACGFRLGEGLAEYVETVRLPNKPPATAASRNGAANPAQQPPQAGPSVPNDWGAMAHNASQQGFHQPYAQPAAAHIDQWKKKKGHKRTHWFIWIIIALIIGSVAGGSMLSPFGLRGPVSVELGDSTPAAHAGFSNYKNVNGGVTFDYVAPPDGPADKAGLLGGDIITSFDGQPVKNVKEFMKLLEATPVGKTVEVGFTRDGEAKTTQLTTISEDEEDRLEELFDNRPEGEGYIAEGTDIDVVPVPGTNIVGVRLNDISENRPADIAGLKDGDIVIEFEGLPMRTRRELESRIVRALPGSIVKFVVMRGSERLEIPVKVGKD
jgi:hypothetical protein